MHKEPRFFPEKRPINQAQIDMIERHISEFLSPLLAIPSAQERSNLLKVIFKPHHDSEKVLCPSVSELRELLSHPAPEEKLDLVRINNESTSVTRAAVIRAIYDICKTLGPSKNAEKCVEYWQDLQFEVNDTTGNCESSHSECSSFAEGETQQHQPDGWGWNCLIS